MVDLFINFNILCHPDGVTFGVTSFCFRIRQRGLFFYSKSGDGIWMTINGNNVFIENKKYSY
ncbi:MAG: hypothetical protein BHW64_02990 [Candidatus Melainabacteria bacterium LEY3_CP_29_8]|nr:MAG: hypothetical protein BHW64_02990 [Candidatus Melainabacteria bacterium LEY3_CP_29_8]